MNMLKTVAACIGLLLLLLSTVSKASFIGDSITIDVGGASTTPVTVTADTSGTPEASFGFGSDESIDIDIQAETIQIQFIDFTDFWAWPETFVDIVFTSLDLGVAITSVSTSGLFFDGNPVNASVLSPNSILVQAPAIVSPLSGTGLITVSFNQVPEPATLALMGLGLAGLGFTRRKKA